MLDLKWIRENPDLVRQGIRAKFCDVDLDTLLSLDSERRSLITEVERLKAKRNRESDQVSKLKKTGKANEAQALITALKATSHNITDIDATVGAITDKIDNILYDIPNMPSNEVQVAPGNKGNKIVRTWGNPRKLSFKGMDHLEIATALGWISMERGSKVTGSAYPVYEGMGARLERGLINFMLEKHVKKGYKEIWPPAIVNRASMTGTGQLPKFEEDMYALKDDDFFLVPTAEVPVTNLLRDEILNEKDLPIRYVAYSPCFRREAGSYGKETRGLSRVHQFDKVEMVKFVKAENGPEELEGLVKDAEDILQALELPYRVVLLGSGDLSFSSVKCYDLEVWAPVTQKWFEVSSCGYFTDFQARRINIRFKRQGQKPEFVHTLNGSGVALARTVLCLLENFQTQDGQVNFPKALETYLK